MDGEQVIVQELGVREAFEDLQVYKAVEGLDPNLQDAAASAIAEEGDMMPRRAPLAFPGQVTSGIRRHSGEAERTW